jgi:hypothetical protein
MSHHDTETECLEFVGNFDPYYLTSNGVPYQVYWNMTCSLDDNVDGVIEMAIYAEEHSGHN